MTVGPLPVEIEVQAGTRLRGHEWLVLGPPVIMIHDEGADLDAWGPALQMSADAAQIVAPRMEGEEPDATIRPDVRFRDRSGDARQSLR